MTIDLTASRAARWTIVLSSACLAGCQSNPQLEVRRLQPAASAETSSFPIAPTTAGYYQTSNSDYHIACESTIASRGSESNRAIIHLHVFWRPRPGISFSDRSTVNTRVRYLALGARGWRLYEGSGFVYPTKDNRTDGLRVRLERSVLEPTDRSGPEAPVALGPISLTGEFIAAADGPAVRRLLNDLERRGVVPAEAPSP